MTCGGATLEFFPFSERQARRAVAAVLGALHGAAGESKLMNHIFERIASRVAAAAGQPLAFVLALTIIIGWGVSGPLFGWSDTWQLVINTGTTIVTFLMVFLIQNAQNRDAAAIQAKLDELIRSIDGARNEFIGIEHLTEGQLERIRGDIEAEYGEESIRSAAMERLIGRR